jgi:hypothetical protein
MSSIWIFIDGKGYTTNLLAISKDFKSTPLEKFINHVKSLSSF